MNYTVVGLFRDQADADKAKSELSSAGFGEDRIDYSTYRSEGEYLEHNYEYKEDEKSQGFWSWLFGDDEVEADRYSRLGSRSFVVTAHADDKVEAERARDIMDNANAIDPNEYDQALTEYNERYQNTDVRNEDFDKNIEVIREELRVGKERVQTGGVNVRSRIVEKPVEESIRLKDERVYLKRTPVDREATEADFRNGTLSMKEYEERAVVDKEARVVEEIELGKEVNTEDHIVKDTVRETEVDIDRDGTAHNREDKDLHTDRTGDVNIDREMDSDLDPNINNNL